MTTYLNESTRDEKSSNVFELRNVYERIEHSHCFREAVFKLGRATANANRAATGKRNPKGDLTTYESILAPDWTTIDLTGHVLEKSEVVQQFASKDRQIDQAFIDDMKVKELGNVAVVTGRTTIYGSYKGQPVRIVLRFTDVFVKRKGRWQVVASQGTQVSS